MPEPVYRTVLHGMCLLDGAHTNEDIAAECPIRRRAERKEKRERKAKRREQLTEILKKARQVKAAKKAS